MARAYSILILPQRGTRIRRLVLSARSIRGFLLGGGILLALFGWWASDYFWMKLQFQGPILIGADAKNHWQRLSGLNNQARDIEGLLADWRGLEQKIRTSLPAKHRASVANGGFPEDLERNLASVRTELERLIASVPTAWPTQGHVSSGFGIRKDPWTEKPGFHSGLDIPKPIGTAVLAPGDGVAVRVGSSNGNGNTVTLDHGAGITTMYAHLSQIHVKEGERVSKGQTIAEVGNTGKSTSSHLHYEVRVNDIPIDPRRNLILESPPPS
ncbi:MAG: M23 family metallopeptidase [Deltaproteobacteria bacterium]|nr:M23 family metallopeptidase [Deltaproteobacteria bacterium]